MARLNLGHGALKLIPPEAMASGLQRGVDAARAPAFPPGWLADPVGRRPTDETKGVERKVMNEHAPGGAFSGRPLASAEVRCDADME
jgi:hypothetical protein